MKTFVFFLPLVFGLIDGAFAVHGYRHGEIAGAFFNAAAGGFCVGIFAAMLIFHPARTE